MRLISFGSIIFLEIISTEKILDSDHNNGEFLEKYVYKNDALMETDTSVDWDENTHSLTYFLSKILGSEAQYYPKILQLFKDKLKKSNSNDIDSDCEEWNCVKIMNTVAAKLKHIPVVEQRLIGWKYFWQILSIYASKNMMNKQTFTIIPWYKKIKSQQKHIPNDVYYLILYCVKSNKLISPEYIKEIFEDIPETDGVLYQIIFDTINNLHSGIQQQWFEQYYPKVLSSILFGQVRDLNQHLLKLIFTIIIKLHYRIPVTLRHLHILYIGAIMGNDILAQSALATTSLIHQNVYQLVNIYNQVDNNIASTTLDPLAQEFNDDEQDMIEIFSSAVGSIGAKCIVAQYDYVPLSYGVSFYYTCKPNQLDQQALNKCVNDWIIAFINSPHYNADEFKLQTRKSWRFFIHSGILRHLEQDKITEIFGLMCRTLKLNVVPKWAHHYFLDGILNTQKAIPDDDLKKLLQVPSPEYLNSKIIEIWFLYFNKNDVYVDVKIVIQAIQKIMENQINISFYCFRIIIQVFFKYDLFSG